MLLGPTELRLQKSLANRKCSSAGLRHVPTMLNYLDSHTEHSMQMANPDHAIITAVLTRRRPDLRITARRSYKQNPTFANTDHHEYNSFHNSNIRKASIAAFCRHCRYFRR